MCFNHFESIAKSLFPGNMLRGSIGASFGTSWQPSGEADSGSCKILATAIVQVFKHEKDGQDKKRRALTMESRRD